MKILIHIPIFIFIAIPLLSLLADKIKLTINIVVPGASPLLSLPSISTPCGAVSLDYWLLYALFTIFFASGAHCWRLFDIYQY
ncbi:hypothetical protein BX661DRAFT_187387 [Kickxella alabastrina]|uniref:uncharacterized protein n=1 Tax=Kickxella alabastrina TaxID=61397 RepID=UPI00221F7047|nr:uncharacterized protein BX661DRAFT_187387 [Kickxella alabastrina]KAI7822434.1 hypothetical protein BX661DRAFT_187387 [Kickxella alabastrina]